jgi:transposase
MGTINNKNNKIINSKVSAAINSNINKLDNPGAPQRAKRPSGPDPEVKAKKSTRRLLTAAYKLRILEQADACKGEPGSIGRLLRSEGLYSSTLAQWRKDRSAGILNGLSAQKRGIKSRKINPLASQIKELEKSKLELEKRLELSQKIIEAQKKIAEIFTLSSPTKSNEDKS